MRVADSGAAPADVIVVLGAAVQPDGTPSAALLRRVRHGVALFHAGHGRALLLSGGAPRRPPAEAELMRELALAAGVPDACIVVEAQSRNTYENACFSAALMRARGWSRALLVSEGYHLPRARIAFRLVGAPVAGTSAAAAPPSRLQRLRLSLRELAACGGMLGRAALAAARRRTAA